MVLALGGSFGLAAAVILANGAYHPNSPVFGRVIGRGPRSAKTIYLTFDDGPSPTATERILAILDSQKTPAAFFLTGNQVKQFPALAGLVGNSPHEIGNHTLSHAKLHLKGPRRIRLELERAHDAIVSAAGRRPRFFRAPHGLRNPFVTSVARELRYHVVGWTFGVWDSTRPGAERIRLRVRNRLQPGAIILLHDGDGYDFRGDRSQTADALPAIIDDARAAGYDFRSLGELINP
jgi:peptidoglycan/xylan/chitin deacetylase (PgdA/CDA1 family)